MNTEKNTVSVEFERDVPNGWLMLPVIIVGLLGSGAFIAYAATQLHAGWLVFLGILVEAVSILGLSGFFTLQPNEARVLLLFGAYR